jgi:tetratricopeptide (TPR) repeat protein
MGRALERRKDFVGAQSFYEGALRLEPEWPGTHIALGRALRLQGKLSESKKELEKALAADPDSREARDELDLTERKLKRPPEMKTREGPRPTS